MKIVVLIENHESGNYVGEHGLSVYIEYKNKKYLLDTGASALFAQNANLSNVDLTQIDTAFLSHAHYDHSGGFNVLFEVNTKVSVYLQHCCKENCYHGEGADKHYVGIPEGMLNQYKDRFTYVSGNVMVDDGVWIIPHHTKDLDKRGQWAKMERIEDGTWVDDDFSHEQSVVFETEEGLMIFNSCCHSGADIVIREVQDAFPGQSIYGIMGGFHLMNIFNSTLDETAKEDGKFQVETLGKQLLDLNVKHVYTGHCTGEDAYDVLKRILGDTIEPLYSGMEMHI